MTPCGNKTEPKHYLKGRYKPMIMFMSIWNTAQLCMITQMRKIMTCSPYYHFLRPHNLGHHLHPDDSDSYPSFLQSVFFKKNKWFFQFVVSSFSWYNARRSIQIHKWLISWPFMPTRLQPPKTFSKPWATLPWQNEIKIERLSYSQINAWSQVQSIYPHQTHNYANAIHIGCAYPGWCYHYGSVNGAKLDKYLTNSCQEKTNAGDKLSKYVLPRAQYMCARSAVANL